MNENARIALKAFFGIAKEWGCTPDEQVRLLGIDGDTLHSYEQLPQIRLPDDTLERISLIMGIYQALRTIYLTPELANERIRKPTVGEPFEGASPMDFMLSGKVGPLWQTRQFFDSILS